MGSVRALRRDWNADRLADEALEIFKEWPGNKDLAFGAFVHMVAFEHAALCQELLNELRAMIRDKVEGARK